MTLFLAPVESWLIKRCPVSSPSHKSARDDASAPRDNTRTRWCCVRTYRADFLQSIESLPSDNSGQHGAGDPMSRMVSESSDSQLRGTGPWDRGRSMAADECTTTSMGNHPPTNAEFASPRSSSEALSVFSHDRGASLSSKSDASGPPIRSPWSEVLTAPLPTASLPGSDSLPSMTHGSSATSNSVGSDLFSAVTPVQTFDPETGETLQNGHLAEYDCPLYFLPCHHRFHDRVHWEDHSLGHFFPHGPPPTGSRCPLCPWHITPDMLPAAELAGFDRRMREAYQVQDRQDMRNALAAVKRAKAERMWIIRQDHVAHHHAQGNSLASVLPDYDIMKYLRDKKLITDPEYRQLLSKVRDGYDRPETSRELWERQQRIRAAETVEESLVTVEGNPRERRPPRA